MGSERRLVFGEVAELYHRHRPGYPEQLVDDLIDLADLDGGEAVLEVGAGTGKATAMFAARGIPVLAVEPSEEMARVARRTRAAHAIVRIERSDFETWEPAGRTFPLVFSAQAWHWVQQPAGYAKAASVLLPGGVLAAFWNRPHWARSELRAALLSAYEQTAPELAAHDGPLHPGRSYPEAEENWEEAIAAADGLTGARIRHYQWTQEYSADAYVALLNTHSAVRVLDEERRAALLAAVADTITAHGDRLTLPMLTRVCTAVSARR
jgi:SAM-dependent methyltransferase